MATISQPVIIPSADPNRGTWLNTHFFQCGDELCMHAYVVTPEGKAEIFKASVAYKPLYDWVVARHRALHAQNGGTEIGFFGLDKIVKKVGRNKLVKGIARQVKSVARSPIAAQATKLFPPADAARKSLVQAANIADAKGNVLKAGLSQMQQAIRNRDPRSAALALAKALPRNLQPAAAGVVNNVYNKVLSVVPGGNVAQLGQGTLNKIMSQAMPGQIKNIARQALAAKKVLQNAGGKSMQQLLPNTAMMVPGVSNRALAAYQGATTAVSAIERQKGLQHAANQVRIARAQLPQIARKIGAQTKYLQQARQSIARMPPGPAKDRVIQNLKRRETQLAQQRNKLKYAATNVAKQAGLLKQLGPQQVQQALRQGAMGQQFVKQTLAAARSANPAVRRQGEQAAAVLKTVANSRQATRSLVNSAFAGMPRISGVEVGCGALPCRACS